MNYPVTPCTIETAVQVSRHVPELEAPYGVEEYHKRFENTPHLILAAWDGEKAVGFKAGYERDGYFYSWMGGVLPDYRKKGVAQALADAQEAWAKTQGYDSITFKTRNVHKAMLIFALRNGFDIIAVEEREEVAANRIWLRKVL
ncbi:MAG: GNAT family N-acetyltransferase [Phaeodactylibacter sp.]|nr:GNAT family N-acetyltransferase [Phaeodactylibacter sp.]